MPSSLAKPWRAFQASSAGRRNRKGSTGERLWSVLARDGSYFPEKVAVPTLALVQSVPVTAESRRPVHASIMYWASIPPLSGVISACPRRVGGIG